MLAMALPRCAEPADRFPRRTLRPGPRRGQKENASHQLWRFASSAFKASQVRAAVRSCSNARKRRANSATCAAASVGAFLVTAQYARKEAALGVLRAEGGETRVSAQGGGILRALYVRDGQIVEKGQKLALIATEQALPGGGLMDEAMLASLAQEQETVTARLLAVDSGAPLEVQSLRAEHARLLAERAAAAATIETTMARLDLAQERMRAGATLMEQGFSTADELCRRQGDVISLQEALGRAKADEAGFAAQLAGLQARLAKLPFDLQVSRGQLEAQAAQLAQARSQLEGRRGYELRAPVAGRVSALQASVGQAVDPAKPLMTLTPRGGVLRAELYVPSRAIGFVKTGQRVRLLYDAFPYQKFGPAWGAVQEVSASVLAPSEVTAAVLVQEPVYRVVAALDAQSLRAFGADVPLQPGMALTADVILEERSFAEWLLEPLLALRARGGEVPVRPVGAVPVAALRGAALTAASLPAAAAPVRDLPLIDTNFQPPPEG
jgi:membrane fusion protein